MIKMDSENRYPSYCSKFIQGFARYYVGTLEGNNFERWYFVNKKMVNQK